MVFPEKIKNNKEIYGRKHIVLNKFQQEKFFEIKLAIMQRTRRELKDNELIDLVFSKFDLNSLTNKN